MVVSDLRGKTIFLDSAPLIYFIDGHTKYQSTLNRLFDDNDNGLFNFVTSTITLLEVIVQPLRMGKPDIALQYQNLLMHSKHINILDITSNLAVSAAQLRATYNLKTPDSIQLATAIECSADYFLTNDLRLKNVTAINILTMDEMMR